MKFLKWITLGMALLNAAINLRVMFANAQTMDPAEVGDEIADVLGAVESAVRVDIPEDLVEKLVAADIEIIQAYYAKKG